MSTEHEMEKTLIELFQQDEFSVTVMPSKTKGYDLELTKNNQLTAVSIKKQKEKVSAAQLEKFQDFLEQHDKKTFASGYLVSSGGFTKAALTQVEREQPTDLVLLDYAKGRLTTVYPRPAKEVPTAKEKHQQIYIGIFTAKGGVGKTTTSAHLAGAFALMGHDVILLDLDPDSNLRKLFLHNPHDDKSAAFLHLPSSNKAEEGATITVLKPEQWREEDHPNVQIIICDCSPVLSENPAKLMKKFDYCIVPTTLNPLGIAKNADVITRTFEHVRSLNTKAELFAVINHYDSSKEAQKRNQVLLTHLQEHLNNYAKTDAHCRLIHPDAAKIRYSAALFYWGYHIVEKQTPQLAFKETAGKSYPRTDFLQLADYLESHSDIEAVRLAEAEAEEA